MTDNHTDPAAASHEPAPRGWLARLRWLVPCAFLALTGWLVWVPPLLLACTVLGANMLQSRLRGSSLLPTPPSLILASAEATGQDPDGPFKTSHRVIADHLRSTSFLMADGVLPWGIDEAAQSALSAGIRDVPGPRDLSGRIAAR